MKCEQRLKLSSSCSPPSSVPLGQALMDTVLEVRDEQGRVLSEGEGQLFIGETMFYQRLKLMICKKQEDS